MQEPRGEEMGIPREAGDVSRDEWRDAAEETVGRVSRDARRLKEDASEAVRGAKARVADAYDRAASTAGRAYRGTRSYVRENPAKASAVSFAAGLGVGIMLASRRGAFMQRSSLGGGLLPLVAIAAAHAVLDVFESR